MKLFQHADFDQAVPAVATNTHCRLAAPRLTALLLLALMQSP